MKRASLVLFGLWFLLLLVAGLHTYGDSTTANAGVYWNLGQHWCGIEYRGHPGLFCDVT